MVTYWKRSAWLAAAMFLLPTLMFALLDDASAASPETLHVRPRSFDGITLSGTIFLPPGVGIQSPVPFVLIAHDWGETRITDITQEPVASLVAAGYGVVTWDSRGFGESDGESRFHDPNLEARDPGVFITYLLGRGWLAMRQGAPLAAITGEGYGGTVALLAAAVDGRITTVAADGAWHELAVALAPNGVPKSGWARTFLAEGHAACAPNGVPARGAGVYPSCMGTNVVTWFSEAISNEALSQATLNALADRSPKAWNVRVGQPTLLLHGYGDTFSPLDQALANREQIKNGGAEVRLYVYEGSTRDPDHASATVQPLLGWFACHLKQPSDCRDAKNNIEYPGGSDGRREANSWPPSQQTRSAYISGVPPLYRAPAATELTQWFIPLETPTAERVSTGAPTLAMRAATQFTNATLFYSVAVRDADGAVTRVGDQTTPVRAQSSLSGYTDVTVRLATVGVAVQPGQQLGILVQTGDVGYGPQRAPGYVLLEHIYASWQSI